MMVSIGEGDVAETVSGAASSVACAHSLQVKRKRNEVKDANLIVVVFFVSMKGESNSLPTQIKVLGKLDYSSVRFT